MNSYFILKCVTSGILVGLISEVARRSPGFAALIASLPLTSILALIWLYKDTHDLKAVIGLSDGIALIVLPSIAFFLVLSLLLRLGWSFWPSLTWACLLMALIYFAYVKLLRFFGISF